MPKMRHTTSLFRMLTHYAEVLSAYSGEAVPLCALGNFYQNRERAKQTLESWNLPTDNMEEQTVLIREEYEALLYLNNCGMGLVPNGYSAVSKPSVEVVHRMLKRQEDFLCLIHRVTPETYKKLDHRKPNKLYLLSVKKEFECVKYYRFQVTLDGWYAKLPERCVTLEERYPGLIE